MESLLVDENQQYMPRLSRFYIPTPYKDITLGPSPICGHYIYEWLLGPYPFYVGSGKTYRAWATHNEQAEQYRDHPLFRVHILKHSLSKRLAHLEERRQTLLRLRQGYILENIRIPTDASAYNQSRQISRNQSTKHAYDLCQILRSQLSKTRL